MPTVLMAARITTTDPIRIPVLLPVILEGGVSPGSVIMVSPPLLPLPLAKRGVVSAMVSVAVVHSKT